MNGHAVTYYCKVGLGINAVASRNGSQGMPGHPPKSSISTGLSKTFGEVLMFNADNNWLA